MSAYDERFHAEGQDPPGSGGAAWPPLDQPSELVQRLRSLRWPEASAEARQRCWMELTRQMDAQQELPGVDAPVTHPAASRQRASDSSCERRGSDGQHERRFGRHDFAARLGTGAHGGALGERIAATRGLASAARI